MEQDDLDPARAALGVVDHNAPEFCAADAGVRAKAWGDLRERCPVAHSDQHGGFWIFSDHASVAQASRHSDIFEHRYDLEADDGIRYVGRMGIPRMAVPELGISEAHGAHHAYVRRVLNPFFAPPVVARSEPLMRRIAAWLIDQHVETGAIDLMDDYITPMTAISTLLHVGFSADLWHDTAEVYHALAGLAPGSPEFARVISVVAPRHRDALLSATKAARERPSDDLLSSIALLELDGQPMDDDQLWSILSNIVGGGVDTTNNTAARGLHQLSADPSLRARVMADRSLIDATCEEALRLYPSGQVLTCTATQDVVVEGAQVRRGDAIVLSFSGANRDPKVFPEPDAFDVDRTPNRHLAFGLGPHRCLGAHVARQSYRVIVSEILDRIPDYVVDESSIVEYEGNPYLLGFWAMTATFTPVPKLGLPRPW